MRALPVPRRAAAQPAPEVIYLIDDDDDEDDNDNQANQQAPPKRPRLQTPARLNNPPQNAQNASLHDSLRASLAAAAAAAAGLLPGHPSGIAVKQDTGAFVTPPPPPAVHAAPAAALPLPPAALRVRAADRPAGNPTGPSSHAGRNSEDGSSSGLPEPPDRREGGFIAAFRTLGVEMRRGSSATPLPTASPRRSGSQLGGTAATGGPQGQMAVAVALAAAAAKAAASAGPVAVDARPAEGLSEGSSGDGSSSDEGQEETLATVGGAAGPSSVGAAAGAAAAGGGAAGPSGSGGGLEAGGQQDAAAVDADGGDEEPQQTCGICLDDKRVSAFFTLGG